MRICGQGGVQVAGTDTSTELRIPSDIRPADWEGVFESQVDFEDLEASGVHMPPPEPEFRAGDPLLQSGDLELGEALGDVPLLALRKSKKVSPFEDSGDYPALGSDTDPSLIVAPPMAPPAAPPPAPLPTPLEHVTEQAQRLDGLVAKNRTAADLRRSLAEQRSALAAERERVAHALATVHLRIEYAVEGAIAAARANMDREREDLEDDREALDSDREDFERDRELLNGLLAQLGTERAKLVEQIREDIQAETENELDAHRRIPTTDFGRADGEDPAENEPTQSAVIRRGKRKTGTSLGRVKSSDASDTGSSRKKPTAPRRRRRRRF